MHNLPFRSIKLIITILVIILFLVFNIDHDTRSSLDRYISGMTKSVLLFIPLTFYSFVTTLQIIALKGRVTWIEIITYPFFTIYSIVNLIQIQTNTMLNWYTIALVSLSIALIIFTIVNEKTK